MNKILLGEVEIYQSIRGVKTIQRLIIAGLMYHFIVNFGK